MANCRNLQVKEKRRRGGGRTKEAWESRDGEGGQEDEEWRKVEV